MRFVPVNLISERLEDRLLVTDFRREDSSLFVCEGLFRYLPQACVERLLVSLRMVAGPGSKLLLNTRENLVWIPWSGRRLFLSLVGEPVHSTFAIGETTSLLNHAGWKITREVRRGTNRTERILISAEPA